MTTRPTDTPDSPSFIRLPEPPEPADMNNHLYLNAPGNAMHLAEHFGNPDTTLIMAGVYISPVPTSDNTGLFEPDLLIAFNADPDAAVARRGYVIAEQGKPPDFVLEIGSRTTGLRDTREKRAGYAALGIPEYWRFDNTGGQYHDAPWPETAWSTAPTNQSRLALSAARPTRAAATFSTWTSAGSTAN